MHLALRGRKIAVPPHIRLPLTERDLTGHQHALRQITVTTVAAYRRFRFGCATLGMYSVSSCVCLAPPGSSLYAPTKPTDFRSLHLCGYYTIPFSGCQYFWRNFQKILLFRQKPCIMDTDNVQRCSRCKPMSPFLRILSSPVFGYFAFLSWVPRPQTQGGMLGMFALYGGISPSRQISRLFFRFSCKK